MADLHFNTQQDGSVYVELLPDDLMIGTIQTDADGRVSFRGDLRVGYLFSRIQLEEIAIRMNEVEKALL